MARSSGGNQAAESVAGAERYTTPARALRKAVKWTRPRKASSEICANTGRHLGANFCLSHYLVQPIHKKGLTIFTVLSDKLPHTEIVHTFF